LKDRQGRLAELALLAVVVFWAANYSIIRFILRSVPVTVFVTIRFLLIAAAGWLVVIFRGESARWRRSDWTRLLAIGVIGGGIYQYLFVKGLALTKSFSSALLNSTAPLLSLGLLVILRIEKILPSQWLGYAIAFGGVGLFLTQSARAGGENFRGDLISLAGALCWAIYGILAKDLSHRYSASVVGAWTYSACFVAIAAYGAVPTVRYPISTITPIVWVAIFASGIGSVTIDWIVWVHAIRRLGVSGTVKYSFVVPVAAGLISAVIHEERFSTGKLVGAFAVLGGIFLARVPGWRTPPVDVET
jgi:drug/metabolite transporter (DMT)-like permease